jgi:hypothetical protein
VGMFDYVVFTCPKCGAKNEDQTKSADCLLNVYEIAPEMDTQIASMLQGDILRCSTCKTMFILDVDIPETVKTNLREIE